ncbi:hypothetical protein SLEP1_g58588 [Rubroshorea leprosula]|uniref:RNA-dependent RNA polymerase n=1 Tax=Rubroshorea leprosula TaxID=152421 RepID=A0AAV5MQZ8_9ROSI|nr:hypothetical protein SLEP1_g58588 [Rubroshorea leprosula]
MGRSSGWLYTALYLKQCSLHLKIAYGGEFDRSLSYPISVSLTGSGYPRIVPAFSRRIIRQKGTRRSELAVQMYLSFFSFFTIVEKAKKIRASLFSSIQMPIRDIDRVVRWLGLAKPLFKELFLRYVPNIHAIPLEQGMRWIPSWKILPTYSSLNTLYQIFPEKARYRRFKSPFLVQTLELSAFGFLVNFINSQGQQWNQGILFEHRVRYALDPNNKVFSGLDLESFESKVGPYLPPWHPAMGPPMLGKLAQTVEGGGKRRLFAIGNWLPMDGTFNQPAPLARLKGQRVSYCYDLTAATDRWPLVVMFELMEILFDRSFASAVVNSALATNRFYIGFLPEQVYPGQVFDKYALLGDDIVISDEQVAHWYAGVLQELQVGISKGKTLISKSGAAEFAKRFVVNCFTTDLSPVSMKSLLGVHNLLAKYALAHRYPSMRFSTFRRLGGSGYKSCSYKAPHLHSRKVRYEWSLWSQLRWPSLEYYFGGGRLLSPSQFWWVMRKVVSAFKPKDLIAPPDIFVSEE